MFVKEFVGRGSEGQYRTWLSRHPDGFVLNTYKNFRVPDQWTDQWIMTLHTASCRTIQPSGNGGNTERNYQKVCSTDADDIVDWIRKQNKGVDEITQTCKLCDPHVPTKQRMRSVARTLASIEDNFERKVEEASSASSAERRRRLENAPKRPGLSEVTIIVFDRNPDVVAEVRERARGKCESCSSAAPFIRRSDGTPYLEVHHRLPLSQGGEDTVENAIALCPNCHREVHFGCA